VYVQLGAFHKPVKCYVMDMLYEVDLILGEEFLDKYDCILHYGVLTPPDSHLGECCNPIGPPKSAR
jgi:hypothetical protein